MARFVAYCLGLVLLVLAPVKVIQTVAPAFRPGAAADRDLAPVAADLEKVYRQVQDMLADMKRELAARESAVVPVGSARVGAIPEADGEVVLHTEDRWSRAVEYKVYRLWNEARAAHGLPPLAWDERVAAFARAKARKFFELRAFGHHVVPGYDIEKLLGKQYRACGENLAGHMNWEDTDVMARKVVDGWLESPGHRKVILEIDGVEAKPPFDGLGIGVCWSSRVVRLDVDGQGEFAPVSVVVVGIPVASWQ